MGHVENKARQINERIWGLVEPVVESEGYEVIEVEYRREATGWVLRLYIDREEGITVEDCARVSQVVGDLLDVTDPIDNPYNLEVSSPGLNRPLRRWEHFRKQLGNVVEVWASEPVQSRKKFKGILVDAGPDGITVDCDGQVYSIPHDILDRARLSYFESLEE